VRTHPHVLSTDPPRGSVFRPSFASWRFARGPGQLKGAPKGDGLWVKVSYACGRRASKEEEAMMDRERPSASDSEEKIPEAWIGQEVMIETTETLSSDLRASAPVYLEDVNDRGIVMLVTRHHDQSQFSRYFYPWSVVGWIRLAEEDERSEPR
jgi:hypothetical protein